MKLDITIQDGYDEHDEVERAFIYGISQIMQDIEASHPDALPFITVESNNTKSPDLPSDRITHGFVIEPDGSTLEIELSNPADDGEILNLAVGGYFELIPNGYGMAVFANEDGLRLNLPFNRNASLLFERHLVGPIACLGAPDAEGDVTSLTDEQRAMIERL